MCHIELSNLTCESSQQVTCLVSEPFGKLHRNTIHQITGPGPTINADVAKLLTEHYGTAIEHIELGYHDYKNDVVE
jgi:hypothetical protein